MKRIILMIILTLISTALGLYYRPSYFLIGQLDWFNVLTKGYFVGSLAKIVSQHFLDESFFFVMRFTAGGLIGSIVLSFMLKGKKPVSKKKK